MGMVGVGWWGRCGSHQYGAIAGKKAGVCVRVWRRVGKVPWQAARANVCARYGKGRGSLSAGSGLNKITGGPSSVCMCGTGQWQAGCGKGRAGGVPALHRFPGLSTSAVRVRRMGQDNKGSGKLYARHAAWEMPGGMCSYVTGGEYNVQAPEVKAGAYRVPTEL